jgi:hypothetical protein
MRIDWAAVGVADARRLLADSAVLVQAVPNSFDWAPGSARILVQAVLDGVPAESRPCEFLCCRMDLDRA